MSTTTFEPMASSAKVPMAPLNRKRSRAAMMLLHDKHQDREDRQHREHSKGAVSANELTVPPSPRPSVGCKRSRISGVMDGLGLIPAAEAWQLNMDDMLSGVVESGPGQKTTDCNGRCDSNSNPNYLFHSSYVPGQSTAVLCVVENTDVHLRLLCASLPHLLTISPTLHPILLTRHSPSSIFSPLPRNSYPTSSLPTIMARNHPTNHFLRLGLLHPLGGGLAGMDALVIIDARGRRRLVVPIGWGVGKGAVGGVQHGADAVGERLIEALIEAVRALEEEGGRAREMARAL